MEAPIGTSSMGKPLFAGREEPSSAAASAEESGWTIYFEDFFASQKKEEDEGASNCTISNIESIVGSSMVSDAASCAAWRFPAAASAKGRKKLSFKKRKARGSALDDDSLEDTASSPVNSPKISEMNSLSLDQRKKDENMQISQEKDIVGFESCTELRREEMEGLSVVDGTANECTELKKKGLCLVPLSMLNEYIAKKNYI